jgi:hypothetical protein
VGVDIVHFAIVHLDVCSKDCTVHYPVPVSGNQIVPVMDVALHTTMFEFISVSILD